MITIEVTQEDIDKGVYRECNRCPIALAVKRAVADPGVRVNSFYATWWRITGTSTFRAELPEEATRFIGDFDARLPVSPFVFTLEPFVFTLEPEEL